MAGDLRFRFVMVRESLAHTEAGDRNPSLAPDREQGPEEVPKVASAIQKDLVDDLRIDFVIHVYDPVPEPEYGPESLD